MVRLETYRLNKVSTSSYAFTFQYGQIRNELKKQNVLCYKVIYIPVWLDQKHIECGDNEAV